VKRLFADIHATLCSREILQLYYKLGYTHVACLEKQAEHNLHSVNTRTVIVDKVVISASNIDDLKSALTRIEHKRTIVTVHPETTEVARWCTHDSRVDTILLTPSNIRVFDKGQFNIMKYYDKPLEVHVPHLLYSSSDIKTQFYRKLNMLLRHRIGLTLGTSTRSLYDLVHPVVVIKAVKTLYDVPERVALLALTDIPRQLIARKQPG
jgi:RNase P/RNase MRP subunit p30